MIELLIAHGADVNAVDEEGKTALEEARSAVGDSVAQHATRCAGPGQTAIPRPGVAVREQGEWDSEWVREATAMALKARRATSEVDQFR
eukprot:762616-Hanusia_phi.AAC.8